MIVIYLDTNALYADPRMTGRSSQDLLSLLGPGGIEVWLSPVVVAEVERQLDESATEAVNKIESAIRKLPRHFDDVDEALTKAITAPFGVQAKQALLPLLEHPACKVLDWSGVSAQELVRRELERRRPTLVKSGQSVGLRDTVIWHDLLDMLSDLMPDDEVIFVTDDGGYLDGDTLVASLVGEIEARVCSAESIVDGGTTHVQVLRGISHVYEQLADRSVRDKAIRLALVGMVEHLDEELWRRRDIAVRSAILPPGFTNPTLEATERIEIVSIGDGEPALCVARALLVFHGTVSTYDYIETELGEWDITTLGVAPGGNDFAVRFTTSATITTEISYDPEAKTAAVGKGRVQWPDQGLLAYRREEAIYEAMVDAATEAQEDFDE